MVEDEEVFISATVGFDTWRNAVTRNVFDWDAAI
jgi:hypothetical protein